MAALFSAYVFVLAMMQRSVRFDSYGANLFELLAIYSIGGLLGGTVVGLLRRYNHTGVGGALIGGLASIPFWIGTLILLEGLPSRWDTGTLVVLLIMIGIGSLLGIHFATSDG